VRTILFYIPAEVAGLSVFGWGWLLWAWLALSAIALAWQLRRPGGGREAAAYLPFVAIVAAVLALLLPNMVEYGPGNQALGIPVRGFGVMLMLATVASVGLAAWRAQQVGIDPEVIYSLSFYMFIAGIAGARLFYIVQYWPQFAHDSLLETLKAVFNVTSGGLVVYGSVLGGVPAGIWYLRRKGLPILPIGDIIAPSMVLGAAIGRIGCFLNGCCFGGVCLTADYALSFPASSPPYVQQLESGWQSGLWLQQLEDDVVVAYVAPGGPAAAAGLSAGQALASINGKQVESLAGARARLAGGSRFFEVTTAAGDLYRWTAVLPSGSVPVHPAQLYAAIDAGLLALLLWVYYPFRRRDGEVFALLLTIHPVSRFLLELVRSDEPGQFGTSLTISQWLSLGILGFACVLWWYIEGFRGQGSGFRKETPRPSAEP
jgi:phosphatidylglycerol---prolipoprotein diacylglyceryl transferase